MGVGAGEGEGAGVVDEESDSLALELEEDEVDEDDLEALEWRGDLFEEDLPVEESLEEECLGDG